MKQLAKQLLLLLLLCLALTALGCAPAEEPPAPPPYPISEHSEALTEACLKSNYRDWDMSRHYYSALDGRRYLTGESGKERGAQLYLVEVEDNCTAYTCAYVHKDIIPTIDAKKSQTLPTMEASPLIG